MFLIVIAIGNAQEYTNSDRNQINNIRYGIYNSCDSIWLVLPTRKSPVDAMEDLEIWNRNGNNLDKCWKIKADGYARIDYSNKWIESNSVIISDTIYIENKFTSYSKDTILDGAIANRINHADTIYYGYIYKDNNETKLIKVKALDTITTACELCPQLPLKKKLNVRFNFLDKNLIKYTELEMPIDTTITIKIIDWSFTELTKRLRYGLNKANDCYFRVSNDANNLGDYSLHSDEIYQANDSLYWHGRNYDYLDVGTWYIQEKFVSKDNENDYVESEIYTIEL